MPLRLDVSASTGAPCRVRPPPCQPGTLSAMTKKAQGNKPVSSSPDWEAIELDYRAGIKTLRQIAGEHGITHGAVNKRAKANGWERDLSAKIQQKADALLSTSGIHGIQNRRAPGHRGQRGGRCQCSPGPSTQYPAVAIDRHASARRTEAVDRPRNRGAAGGTRRADAPRG